MQENEHFTVKQVNRALRFTLLELMVGMTVLSILMLMLFRFILSTQQTLNWSDSMWRVYENSRVILDLFEQDLQASLKNELSQENYPFYMGDSDITDQNNDLRLCFVASIDPPNTDADSRLCEVCYRFHQDTSPASTDYVRYTLYRQVIYDEYASPAPDWDFRTNPLWYANSSIGTTKFQKVAGGIMNLDIQFFYNTTTPFTVPVGGHDTMVRPISVRITFDLFDETLENAPEEIRNRTRRGFYKDIDINKF